MSDSLRSHGLLSTRLLCPWDFPGKSTGVGCHFLLQGIFLTQGSNPALVHCRQTFYPLSHQGSPTITQHTLKARKTSFVNFFYFLTLQYCIGFAIYQNESATGIHVFSILNPPPSSLPIPSLWVFTVHQPQASSILHRTWTGDSFHI